MIKIAVIAMLIMGCSRPKDPGASMALSATGALDYAGTQVITTVDANSTMSAGTVGPGVVRIACSTSGHVRFGASPTALITDPLTAISAPIFVYLSTAQKAAIIRDTTTNPTCSFTTMSFE